MGNKKHLLMKVKKAVPALLAVCLCAGFTGNVYGRGGLVDMIPLDKENEEENGKRAEEIVASMTLEEKIQQMLMPAFRVWTDSQGNSQNVTALNESLTQFLGSHHFGGVILFGENLETAGQTLNLTYELQQAVTQTGGLPLLLGTDQEGGEITRLSYGTAMPGNMALGASGKSQDAYEAGRVTGEELAALGINVDFAPVLDVNSNPSNPVVGVRSFSSDPNRAADLGAEMIKGLHSTGTAAAVKHFPGHGDTSTDSHTGLPRVDKSYEEVAALELLPFQRAVEEGTDLVMTAHIQYPQIETQTYASLTGELVNLPATLSKTFITEILRGKMGFDGVVVTDAMNMGAIQENFSARDAARMAVNAGVDLLLMPVTIESQQDFAAMESYIQEIQDMVAAGEISERTITEAALRIVKLKERKGILDQSYEGTPSQEQIDRAQSTAGSKEHRQKERDIAARSVTVVKNQNQMLPIKAQAGQTILVLGAYDNEVTAMEYGLSRLQKEGKVDPDVIIQGYSYTEGSNLDVIQNTISTVDYVIVVSELGGEEELNPYGEGNWMSLSVETVIASAKTQGKPVAVLSIGQPYDAGAYPQADAMILAYCSAGMNLDATGEPAQGTGANLAAAFDVITGTVPPQGTLPVDIPALDENYRYTTEIQYPVGTGILDLSV